MDPQPKPPSEGNETAILIIVGGALVLLVGGGIVALVSSRRERSNDVDVPRQVAVSTSRSIVNDRPPTPEEEVVALDKGIRMRIVDAHPVQGFHAGRNLLVKLLVENTGQGQVALETPDAGNTELQADPRFPDTGEGLRWAEENGPVAWASIAPGESIEAKVTLFLSESDPLVFRAVYHGSRGGPADLRLVTPWIDQRSDEERGKARAADLADFVDDHAEEAKLGLDFRATSGRVVPSTDDKRTWVGVLHLENRGSSPVTVEEMDAWNTATRWKGASGEETLAADLPATDRGAIPCDLGPGRSTSTVWTVPLDTLPDGAQIRFLYLLPRPGQKRLALWSPWVTVPKAKGSGK